MEQKNRLEAPGLFQQLMDDELLRKGELCCTGDGFHAAACSISHLLARKGIEALPCADGKDLVCRLFFDDWYLYAVPWQGDFVYSLFKMREQEDDHRRGLYADGDDPGVTIPFVAMDTGLLTRCLARPTQENKMALNAEIDRVVARRGQTHHRGLKEYFIRTRAQGPYLIAQLYIRFITSLAQDGSIPVPERYADEYARRGERGRLARFIRENNEQAGRVICDHKSITLRDPAAPSEWERLAILATHTGNTSLYSFAAEVQFHARFLAWWARIPIPFAGTPYASAVRADMSVADAEMVGPTPYYRSSSRSVRRQLACHADRAAPAGPDSPAWEQKTQTVE